MKPKIDRSKVKVHWQVCMACCIEHDDDELKRCRYVNTDNFLCVDGERHYQMECVRRKLPEASYANAEKDGPIEDPL